MRPIPSACCAFGGSEVYSSSAAVHASISNHFNQERAFYSRQKFMANRTAL